MKRAVIVCGIVALVALVLRVVGLPGDLLTPDDAMVPVAALNYVEHGQPGPVMTFHPNMRNLLVYASTRLFGFGVLGIKGWSLLLGTLSVFVLGLIVHRLSQSLFASWVAAALLALDIVHISYSRQAIQEVHTTFFFLVGVYLVVECLVRGTWRAWRVLLPFAGVAFGFGVASKFHAIPPLLVSIGLVTYWCVRRRAFTRLIYVAACLVGLPFLIYLWTYYPWFGLGYSFGEWVAYQGALLEAMRTHTRAAIGFLAHNEPAHWFIRPFMGYADYSAWEGRERLAVAVGNPVVWFAVLPAVAYSLLRRRGRSSDIVLQLYFWTAYLPLALSSRPVWVLSAIAVIPFAFGIIAVVLDELRARFPRSVALYLAAALFSSVLLYPLASGRALEHAYLRPIVSRMGDVRTVQLHAPSQ